MSYLMSTHYKVNTIKTSGVISNFINQLYDTAIELKRVEGNWYARNSVHSTNEKASQARLEYNKIREYYNVQDENEIVDLVSELKQRISIQPKNSILNIVELNSLQAKLNDLNSILKLKGVFPILPKANDLINYLYSPISGEKLFV